jgi:hypothetical protein
MPSLFKKEFVGTPSYVLLLLSMKEILADWVRFLDDFVFSWCLWRLIVGESYNDNEVARFRDGNEQGEGAKRSSRGS